MMLISRQKAVHRITILHHHLNHKLMQLGQIAMVCLTFSGGRIVCSLYIIVMIIIFVTFLAVVPVSVSNSDCEMQIPSKPPELTAPDLTSVPPSQDTQSALPPLLIPRPPTPPPQLHPQLPLKMEGGTEHSREISNKEGGTGGIPESEAKQSV